MDSAHYLRGKGENVLVLRKSLPSTGRKKRKRPRTSTMISVVTGLLEELSSCYESLSAIFRYSTEPGYSRDMKKFAHRLLSDLAAVVGAEWFVFRSAQNQSHIDVLTASESALDAGSIFFRGEKRDAGFLDTEAAISRKPVWFDENHQLAAADPMRLKPRSRGVVYPVFVDDELAGTLAVGKSAKTSGPHQRGLQRQPDERHRGIRAISRDSNCERARAGGIGDEPHYCAGTGNCGQHPTIAAVEGIAAVAGVSTGGFVPERAPGGRRFF